MDSSLFQQSLLVVNSALGEARPDAVPQADTILLLSLLYMQIMIVIVLP